MFFIPFGFVHDIILDNETYFKNEKIRYLYANLKSNIIFRYPQGNGQVDAINKIITYIIE